MAAATRTCQLGEGNCFLRVPPGLELRPVLTGWFSEFAELADTATRREVRYGKGAARFAGATYDPTSHYRAAAVFAFHQRMGMTPERLRAVNQHQVAMLIKRFEALDVDPAVARSFRSNRIAAQDSSRSAHRKPAPSCCVFARVACMPTREATSCGSVPRPTFLISNCSKAAASSRLCFASSLFPAPCALRPMPYLPIQRIETVGFETMDRIRKPSSRAVPAVLTNC